MGEDVTHNAKYIEGLPMQIPYDGHLVVRGRNINQLSGFRKNQC